MSAKGSPQGGRRHGLSPTGVTKPRQMRLGPVAETALAQLVASTGLTASEITRRLICHPSAASLLADLRKHDL